MWAKTEISRYASDDESGVFAHSDTASSERNDVSSNYFFFAL